MRSWKTTVLLGLMLAFSMPSNATRAVECTQPLPQETIDALDLFTWRTSVQPGRAAGFSFGELTCCYSWPWVPACVEWSVEPSGAATLVLVDADPDNYGGILNVAPETPHGTVITLTADVESGRKTLSLQFHVYTPELNPLVGYWLEVAQITCPSFVRGNVDQLGTVQISDAILILDFLFSGAEEPSCLAAADSNGDGSVNLSDGIYLLEFLFSGGPQPRPPYPECQAPHPVGGGPGCRFGSCDIEEIEPAVPIQELLFEADGSFQVTWRPFELYVDYHGAYTYDLATGSLRMGGLYGSYVPRDFWMGDGKFTIEGPSRWHLAGHSRE